ncbi:hypothetical protein GJ496_002960 [Pomphorhynchus laevis]|nr:hypothetical protein GJ496_002960 [Pomphorhynchus laevis]
MSGPEKERLNMYNLLLDHTFSSPIARYVPGRRAPRVDVAGRRAPRRLSRRLGLIMNCDLTQCLEILRMVNMHMMITGTQDICFILSKSKYDLRLRNL